MTPTEQDLARELARHPGWKWMRGMTTECGLLIIEAIYDRVPLPGSLTSDQNPATVTVLSSLLFDDPHEGTVELCDLSDAKMWPGTLIPDLADPATQGCLIAMLRIPIWISDSTFVYDEKGIHQVWAVTVGDDKRTSRGQSLGEALARAWLAVHRD